MTISLNKNILSLTAQRRLNESSSALSKTFERLSSGLRINRASDDPAGLALSSQLDAKSRVLGQAIRNINDGLSITNIALSATSNLTEIVTRISELAEQAANGVYSSTQRDALDREAQALVSEYNRSLASVEFNDIALFNPNSGNLVIQGGLGSEAATSINLTQGLTENVGDGTFAAATSTSTLGFHNFGDFDGDGITDMLGVQITTIRFAKGLGDGTFAATTNLGNSGGASSRDNRLADINKDGFLDVISADGNGSIFTRLGDGSGGFLGAATSFSSGFASADALQVADINGDGSLDLLFQTASGGTGVGVVLGNGDGTYRVVQSLLVPVDTGLTTTDFNNDGKLDLATGKNVYLGRGDGTFNSASFTTTDFLLTSGDFNGDGYEDLVTYNTSISVRLGNGDGTFASNLTIAGTTGLIASLAFSSIDRALAADVNRDGRDDLALDFRNFSEVRVFLAQGDGTFTQSATVSTVAGSYLWRFEDANQDGVPDVDVVVFATGSNGLNLANTSLSTNLIGIDLSSQANARASLSLLTQKLVTISNAESSISAFQSRLEIQMNFISRTRDEYRVASARITDVDVAEETAKLVQAQIRIQMVTSILAQANQQPQLLFKLLQP